jgi:hypothetical protein
MTLQDIRNQARRLPDADKWQLVRMLLDELQQQNPPTSEAISPVIAPETPENLSPWIKKLIGIAHLEPQEDPKELYINYLEEKYN